MRACTRSTPRPPRRGGSCSNGSAERAGVSFDVIDYPAPQPLPALWKRSDLGCAFMCGYPFATKRAAADAARGTGAEPCGLWRRGRSTGPIWSWRRTRRSRICTMLSASAFAWTTEDSQSGWQAPRLLLAAHAKRPARAAFQRDSVGPLVTPRNVALADCRRARRRRSARQLRARSPRAGTSPRSRPQLRVIARTPATPIPPLVGAPGMNPPDAARVRDALLAVGSAHEHCSRARIAAAFEDSPPLRRKPTTRSSPTRAVPMRLAIPASPESMSKRVD